MYKTQFAQWGFEKNLTRTRVRRLMKTSAAAGGASNSINTVRIHRYFKRRKAAHSTTSGPSPQKRSSQDENMADISELGVVPVIHELDGDCCILERVFATTIAQEQSRRLCDFAKMGNRKFRVEDSDEYV